MKQNSFARIQNQGLMGSAAIHISAGTPDAALLIAKIGEPYPVIAGQATVAGNLFDAGPELVNNANALVTRLNTFVAENEMAMRKANSNIEAFSQALETNKDNVAKVMEDAGQVTERVKVVAERLDALVARNEESVQTTLGNVESFSTMLKENKDSVKAVIEDAKTMANQVTAVTEKLDKLLMRIKNR